MTELYTVQAIIGKRVIKGVTEYRVRWKGYSEDECTWEPYKNLKYVDGLIKAFQKKLEDEKKTAVKTVTPKISSSTVELPHPKMELYYEQDHSSVEQIPQMSKKPIQPKASKIEVKHEPEKQNQDEEIFFELDSQEQIVEQTKQQEDEPVSQPFKSQVKSITESFNSSKKYTKKSSKQNEKMWTQQKQELNLPDQSAFNSKARPQPQPQGFNKKLQKHHMNGKKKPQLVPANKKEKRMGNPKGDSSYSELRKIEENMRFRAKTTGKGESWTFNLSDIKINKMSKDSEGNFIYLVQAKDLYCYMKHQFFVKKLPDELIRFYESKIEFNKIPKLSK